jgi:hypothetical protein
MSGNSGHPVVVLFETFHRSRSDTGPEYETCVSTVQGRFLGHTS